MKAITAAAAACCALAAATTCAAGPFDQFRGKMKPGMYEMKMDMDMGAVPGMPPGMGKQSHTIQHCVTQEDLDKGAFSRNQNGRGGPNESCEVKNMKVSGNTATYQMECTKPKMSADNKITFNGDGYTMDMKMAMDQGGGRMMNMSQHVESKLIGPCSK